MTPVEAQDFRKLNEFAEATMTYRNPEKSRGNQGNEKEKIVRTQPGNDIRTWRVTTQRTLNYGYGIARQLYTFLPLLLLYTTH